MRVSKENRLEPIITTGDHQYDPIITEIIQAWNLQPNLRNTKIDFKTKACRETYEVIKTILFHGFKSFKLDRQWREKYNIDNTAPLTPTKIRYSITIIGERAVTQQYAYAQKLSLKNFLYNYATHSSLCLQILHTEGAQAPEARLKNYLTDTLNDTREKLRMQAIRLNREIFLKTDKQINEEAARCYTLCVDRARRAINFSMGFHQSDPWISKNIEKEAINIIYDVCTKSRMKYQWDFDYWDFETAVYSYFDFVEILYDSDSDSFNIHYLKVWGNAVWEKYLAFQKKNQCEVIRI